MFKYYALYVILTTVVLVCSNLSANQIGYWASLIACMLIFLIGQKLGRLEVMRIERSNNNDEG